MLFTIGKLLFIKDNRDIVIYNRDSVYISRPFFTIGIIAFTIVQIIIRAQSRLNEIGVLFFVLFFVLCERSYYSSFFPSHTVNENELVKFVLVLVLPYGTAFSSFPGLDKQIYAVQF